uniref:Uncharacterized protein n=1 Tax=Physcomitrium patens TaxID=3218 RepID=A0A2K1KPF5_PHYPA|nr:hypothetical protein PHYPA_006571 [Physcomitrium patens]
MTLNHSANEFTPHCKWSSEPKARFSCSSRWIVGHMFLLDRNVKLDVGMYPEKTNLLSKTVRWAAQVTATGILVSQATCSVQPSISHHSNNTAMYKDHSVLLRG